MSLPPQQVNTMDGTAIGVALLSFFKVVPWPEIAAFFSVVYLLIRIYFVLKNKGKN
jgi:hypothetical protein